MGIKSVFKNIAASIARSEDNTTPQRTTGYQPLSAIAWWNQPRDLPLFTFETVRLMLWDPEVRLSLAMRCAPLRSVKFAYEEGETWTDGINAVRPEVGAFVHRQLKRIWANHIDEIAKAQAWGWSAGEVTLRLTRHKLVEVNRLEARQAMDCKLITRAGNGVGIQVNRIPKVGTVDLHFPNAWFHCHDPESGEIYGRSVLLGAYSPWADKWLNGGALDVRRLFMHKDAYAGADLGYPEGTTFVGDQQVPNRDIARQIVEQITSGGATTRPSTRDENGNEKWPLTRATTSANPAHILEYPRDLDREIRHGIGIPDDVIDSDGSGAWAGKRIPMAAFYTSLDSWVSKIYTDLNEQIIQNLVLLNFGKAEDYEIAHKPLAEQAMEQQSNAGPGLGDQQGTDSFGSGYGWQPARTADDRPAWKSARMSLDPIEAVGTGIVDVAELVKAAKASVVEVEQPNA